MSTAPPKPPWRWIALSVALFVTLRAVTVAALGDVFFYGEELEKAAAGMLMLERWDVPHHVLAYHAYEGGGFVTSHLVALFFALFAPNLLTLKLVAVLWSLATLVLGALFVSRHFGARAGAVFALLFACAPASLQLASLLNLGIHFQALLFVPLIVGSAWRIAGGESRSEWLWFVFGCASGFGVYYSYQCAVVVAFALLSMLAREPRAFLGRASHFGWIGALIGGAPLLWMANRVGSEVLDIHGARLGDGRGLFETLRAFASSVYAAPTPAAIVLPLVLVGALVCGPRTLGRGRGRVAWFGACGFLLLELAAYAASGFAVGAVEHPFVLNRLSFVAFAGLLVIAPVVGWGLGRPGTPRRLAGLALAGWIGASLWGTATLVSAGRPGAWGENLGILARARGYDYAQYLFKIAPDLDGDAAQKLALMLEIEEPNRTYLQRSAVLALTADWEAEQLEFDQLRAIFEAQQGVEDWREFLPGLSVWLRDTTGQQDPAARLARLANYAPEWRPQLAEAVSRFGLGLHPFWERLALEAAIEPPSSELSPAGSSGILAERWFRGLGARVVEAARLDPDACERFLMQLPEARRSALRRGVEAAAADARLGN